MSLLEPWFGSGYGTTATANTPMTTKQETASYDWGGIFTSLATGAFDLGKTWMNGNTAVKVADAQTNANAATLQTSNAYIKWGLLAAVGVIALGGLVLLSRRK